MELLEALASEARSLLPWHAILKELRRRRMREEKCAVFDFLPSFLKIPSSSSELTGHATKAAFFYVFQHHCLPFFCQITLKNGPKAVKHCTTLLFTWDVSLRLFNVLLSINWGNALILQSSKTKTSSKSTIFDRKRSKLLWSASSFWAFTWIAPKNGY